MNYPILSPTLHSPNKPILVKMIKALTLKSIYILFLYQINIIAYQIQIMSFIFQNKLIE